MNMNARRQYLKVLQERYLMAKSTTTTLGWWLLTIDRIIS